MNEQSERFRRITMKVLTMQLNSITIMDLVAYGGAAAGILVAVAQLRAAMWGWAAASPSCCWRRISSSPCASWAASSTSP